MNSTAAIVCIGEFLWDMLPTGRQPGGAPYNVAAHLQQWGQPVQLISRVGDDELGTELLTVLEQRGLGRELIQLSRTHLTGLGKVNHKPGRQTYEIVEPVAWDFLQHTAQLRAAVSEARLLVYGSLAARSATTRETLYRLLQVAPYKVFDVNLRLPHYSRRTIEYLLGQADLVKLNQEELSEIMQWIGQPATEATALPQLARHFGIQTVCLTKGAAGASLWHEGQLEQQRGLPVVIHDTLGSSDAFLAALLAHWPTTDLAACLRTACAAATLVATQPRASPIVAPTDILTLST